MTTCKTTNQSQPKEKPMTKQEKRKQCTRAITKAIRNTKEQSL